MRVPNPQPGLAATIEGPTTEGSSGYRGLARDLGSRSVCSAITLDQRSILVGRHESVRRVGRTLASEDSFNGIDGEDPVEAAANALAHATRRPLDSRPYD